MNLKMKNKLPGCSLLLGLFMVVVFEVGGFPRDREKNSLETTIILDVAHPASEKMGKTDEYLARQLAGFLKIAALVDEKNRERPFNLLGNQVKGKIARWLAAASEIETQDCYKKYLRELSENIREQGRFTVDLPPWVSLEPERAEIVFPRADRYSAALLVLQTFFDISTGAPPWGKGHFIDAVVYVNSPDDTLKFKEYSAVFPLMQDHLSALSALSASRQEISYTPVIPSFKISQLVFSSLPESSRITLVYPDIDDGARGAGKNTREGEDQFKIIVFKNMAAAYFEGVLKPISACILTDQQLSGPDADVYISNLVMRRIAHHLGPVLVAAPKGEEGAGKGGKVSPKKARKPTTEMELKTVSELLGDLFPVLEAVKSHAAAVYNTPVLINNGLLPDDKAMAVYLTYLVSLIDRIRNTPPEMVAPQQYGKKNWEQLLGDPTKENYLAGLIQFNYLLAKESIILNISNHTLDLDRAKFETAVGELTGEVIRVMAYPNYDSARWFIDKNSALPDPLAEILKSLRDIPVQVEFRLAKPAVGKEGDGSTD